ncbi:uncharacterized protein LOC143590669 [Bidens hawaiensis]|uniref:uncharacterized protein LOC143590669 n=1 Tax=Bidens hawaiensis TaxID=980011 RepID=UPI0040493D92
MDGSPSQNPSSNASVTPQNTNTTSSEAHTNFKKTCLNRDMAWEWGECRYPLKKQAVWCKLCFQKMNGGITRLKQHLTHTGGQVRGCTKVTLDIQKRVMESMREKAKVQLEKKRNLEILRSNSIDLADEDEEDQYNEQDVGPKEHVAKKKKFVGASNVRGPMDAMFKTDLGKRKQTTIDRNNPIKKKLETNAWEAISDWAYAINLPFNAVRDESFPIMLNAIGEYGRGLPPPSYHNMRITLLNKRVEKTKKFVDSFRPHWEEYGCSIMSDFWTDGKGRCLINFLVNCPLGTIFLKSLDASEHVKNAELIVGMINEVIEDVGEANIVQLITDNGSNFKAAGKILEQQHPKMFWTSCAAHCVNLMI